MKTHTAEFKNEIKKQGREIDSVITYTENGATITLSNEDLNAVTPSYKGSLLKSTMRQLEIDSNVSIPLDTIINFQFGVKVRDNEVQDYRDNYDYVNYGNYVVKKVEKQEANDSYLITCYDKMVYSMIDYETPKINGVAITYPITIRNYIAAICSHLGLTFKNASSTFTNYDKEIPGELYLDSNGKTMYYTFRDVLDELAAVTASSICINEVDDELEIRYTNNTNDTIDEENLKNVNVSFGKLFGPINQITLSRSADADKISKNDAASISENGLTELKIMDNQILNGDDRQDYLNEIFSKLNGLSFYLNNYSTYGVCYYNLCDRYNVSVGETLYSCIMFNDEVLITQGLEENIITDEPLNTSTNYAEVAKEQREDNRAKIEVDKANARVEAIVENIGEDGEVTGASLLLAINNDTSQATIHADKISLEGLTTINNNFEIDTNGNAILNGGDINLHDNGDPFDLDQSTIFISGISSTYGNFYNYKSSMWEYMQNNAVNGTTYSNTNSALGIKIYYNDTTGVEPVYKGININLKDDITDTYVNPQIHIYADPEGDFTNIIPSGIGINGPNAGISINNKSVVLEDEFYYSSGDYTFSTLCAVGFVSGGTQEIVFSFPVGKSMANINSISIVSGAITIRGTSGYVENSGTSPYFSLTNTNSYTYSVNSPDEGNIRFSITKKSGTYSNVTNNTPVVVYLRNVKLRFS